MRRIVLMICLFLPLSSCSDQTANLQIAVTTSTRDSGLLDVLLPAFEKQNKIQVDVLAVGTGAALQLGRSGDVDLIIVHDRAAELQFMADRAGTRHAPLFTNAFVIIGPPDDPQKISGLSPVDALKRLEAENAKYVSRGDDSGTNRKEKSLFAASGITKLWSNCVESGRGMGTTLTMAHQMQAYVLSDRATFLRFKPKIDLKLFVEKGAILDNPYSAIVVSEKLRGSANIEAARKLCDFLTADNTRKKIAQFQCEGEYPFVPIVTKGK